jgi:hypothetical protein
MKVQIEVATVDDAVLVELWVAILRAELQDQSADASPTGKPREADSRPEFPRSDEATAHTKAGPIG